MRADRALSVLLLLAPAALAAQRAGAPGTSSAPPPALTIATAPRAVVTDTDYTLGQSAVLRAAPTGPLLAHADSGVHVTALARDRGWVRVRLEGWVRESDLIAADSGMSSTVSAADLRAQPDKYRGETVRWAVQVIAYQTADPLRRDLAPDEPYLLARGPGREDALLYLALPPSLTRAARAIEPLSNVIITARVRAGRSDPSGVPVLDVESIVRP